MVRLAFFSRGRGFGHAIPDLEVLEHLSHHRGLSISLYSYDAGLRVFSDHGHAVADLGFSASDEYSDRAFRVLASLLRSERPDLVVAHEVFPALPAAHELGIPALLMTHWFFQNIRPVTPDVLLFGHFYHYAAEILMLDLPQFHKVPSSLRSHVTFCGPIARTWAYRDTPASAIRASHDLPEDKSLALVTVGGSTDVRRPVLELAARACARLQETGVFPLIIAGPLRDEIHRLLSTAGSTTGHRRICDFVWDLPALMRASDVIVSAASSTSLFEAAALGVPTLALDDEINPVDSFHARKLAEVGACRLLRVAEASIEAVAQSTRELLQPEYASRAREASHMFAPYADAAQRVAKIILRHCEQQVARP